MSRKKPADQLRELRKFAREINKFFDRIVPIVGHGPRALNAPEGITLPEGFHVACCETCGAPGVLVHHCESNLYGAVCLQCRAMIVAVEDKGVMPEGKPN